VSSYNKQAVTFCEDNILPFFQDLFSIFWVNPSARLPNIPTQVVPTRIRCFVIDPYFRESTLEPAAGCGVWGEGGDEICKSLAPDIEA
jgi:hypothetical protein